MRCLSADGGIICAALRTRYIIFNSDQGQVQELFPFDKDGFTPFICRVSKVRQLTYIVILQGMKAQSYLLLLIQYVCCNSFCLPRAYFLLLQEEFLVSGPDGLGVFVCSAGTSNRPPLQWSYPINSVAFHHPYILGVSNEIIMVHRLVDAAMVKGHYLPSCKLFLWLNLLHSIVDQQQKQAIPFVGGQIIGNYDGEIFVCSLNALHTLIPVPWEKQVEVSKLNYFLPNCFVIFVN